MNRKEVSMKITCEGKEYELFDGATPQTLWNMVRGGRDKNEAVLAEIGGNVIGFQTPFPSDGVVRWVSANSPKARRAYQRTLVMLLVCGVHEVYGKKIDVLIRHSLGKSLYCEFSDKHIPLQRELDELEKTMKNIVAEKRDITQMAVGKKRAIAFLRMNGRIDDAALLSQMTTLSDLQVNQCGPVIDYYLGPLFPDMGYVGEFRLRSYAPGFLIQISEPGETAAKMEKEDPLFAKVFLESQHWSELIGCRTLSELNQAIDDGQIHQLIAVAEALHEKKLAELADAICHQDFPTRLVCIAGPSSSGKTTFMRRLIVHLWVHGAKPVMLSLDDYFKNREEMERKNWENLDAIDLPLFESAVTDLLNGKEVYLPSFNFMTGKKEWSHTPVTLGENQPILVEGLHALNPQLTYFVPGYQCMHVYLSALTQIGINNHNRISTSDTRLLRRLVRDARFRGNGAKHTLSVWDNVRKGEERNIFHFQDRAEFIFNSALLYEIPVLKGIALPLLNELMPKDPEYSEAQRLLHFLEPFRTLSIDAVPDHSLLREFIGQRRKVPLE